MILHARGSNVFPRLPLLARQLRHALDRSQVPPPYLLVGHSFGALVIRQFAALYPESTAGLLFVDGLPPTTPVPRGKFAAAIATARTAELLAALHLLRPVLPHAQKHIRLVNWALQELSKLPPDIHACVLAEWFKPEFYQQAARMIAALPANLKQARTLSFDAPSLSLHSDYPDPTGTHVEDSGHWIQVDQPAAVAAAVRRLHAIIEQKGV